MMIRLRWICPDAGPRAVALADAISGASTVPKEISAWRAVARTRQRRSIRPAAHGLSAGAVVALAKR